MRLMIEGGYWFIWKRGDLKDLDAPEPRDLTLLRAAWDPAVLNGPAP